MMLGMERPLDAEQAARLAKAMNTSRGRLGLTQYAAAQLGGIGETTWRELEKGENTRPRVTTLEAVAKALEWPEGAVDRVLEGQPPRGLDDALEGAVSTAVERRLAGVEEELQLLRDQVGRLLDHLEGTDA